MTKLDIPIADGGYAFPMRERGYAKGAMQRTGMPQINFVNLRANTIA